MDPVANPYRPGAGRRPPLLAGREPLLASFDVLRRRAEEHGEGDRGWILNGLRGVGKTVLLNEFQRQVSTRGWIASKVEATSGTPLPTALNHSLVAALRTATGRHPEPRLRRLLGVFKAFSLTVDPKGSISLGVDVQPVTGVADSGRLADDLAALFEALGSTARDLGIGVLVLIDELQEARRGDLAALNSAVHQLGQHETPPPLLVIGAGLPSLPAQLAEATSYAERLYDYRSVGLLDIESARQALVVPAAEGGATWDTGGLHTAVSTAGGYPYFIQAIGKHVWDNARTNQIGLEDVEVGLADAQREVDDGLYRSRWERATPAQRDLLRSLAFLGGDGPAAIADIVKSMGKVRASDISVARNELIKKGLLYAPERGLLAFTVPGMHNFIDRQP